MERDKGIEPSPPPWQGGVLPLYESRARENSSKLYFYSMRLQAGQGFPASSEFRTAASIRAAEPELKLVDFQNACRLYDRRFLLALGEALGAVAVDVDASELLAVMIVDRHLPVPVLATPIFVQPRGPLHSFFLFHDWLIPSGRGIVQVSAPKRKCQVMG